MSVFDVIEWYKKELEKFSLQQLRYNSADGVWSIGQMYDHIILVAHEYLEHVKTCANENEEQTLGKTTYGEELFNNGGFPPIKIKLPDELNAPPNNTDSIEKLINRLNEVIEKLKEWETKVDCINPNYKVKHGGFGWLNAREWYDLVEMHFCHHFRQKKDLENALVGNE